MDSRKFNIEVTLPERWVDDFCTFLQHLEVCGQIGHSAVIAFYADGDGDFKPQFKINTDFNEVLPIAADKEMTVEALYDAG